MSFGGGGGGGGGSIGTASDVFVSSLGDGQVLEYNGTTFKWNNTQLTERIQDVVGAMIVAGAQVSLNYDDSAGTLTISSTTPKITVSDTAPSSPATGDVWIDTSA